MTTFAETEKTELKQKYADSVVKEIVAFLNTDGGTVLIGVNDDGTVCGVSDLDEVLKRIADIIESQILPDPRQFVELGTKFVEQKHVVEIKVGKGEDLYYIKKYGRSAQSTTKWPSFWPTETRCQSRWCASRARKRLTASPCVTNMATNASLWP